jgi:hypothetical protein
LLAVPAGIRLRTPGVSLGSYWTGEPVPIVGDFGSTGGCDWRTSGYSSRADRLP